MLGVKSVITNIYLLEIDQEVKSVIMNTLDIFWKFPRMTDVRCLVCNNVYIRNYKKANVRCNF